MESKNLLTVSQVAKMLGVTPLTLRNWDKNGKLVALRHPLNNYRVYKKADIDNLLESMDRGAVPIYIPRHKKSRKLVVKHE